MTKEAKNILKLIAVGIAVKGLCSFLKSMMVRQGRMQEVLENIFDPFHTEDENEVIYADFKVIEE